MRSVWICSRNDSLGNLAVMLAALGCSAQAPAGRTSRWRRSWRRSRSGVLGRWCSRPRANYEACGLDQPQAPRRPCGRIRRTTRLPRRRRSRGTLSPPENRARCGEVRLAPLQAFMDRTGTDPPHRRRLGSGSRPALLPPARSGRSWTVCLSLSNLLILSCREMLRLNNLLLGVAPSASR